MEPNALTQMKIISTTEPMVGTTGGTSSRGTFTPEPSVMVVTSNEATRIPAPTEVYRMAQPAPTVPQQYGCPQPGGVIDSSIIRDILRHVPRGPIPTVGNFAALQLGLVSPGTHFDVPYCPLRALLNDPGTAAYLVASATESGGSMTATIAHAAANWSYARTLRIAYDTDPDSSGLYNALETITFNPEQLNGLLNVTEDPTTGVTVVAEQTNASITARVTLPPTTNGGFYLHLNYRTTSLPKTIPMRGCIVTGTTVAGDDTNLTSVMDIACATTGMTSGSLVHKTASVIAPGSPYFEEYVGYMLRNYYERL